MEMTMAFPAFYNPDKVGQLYMPDIMAAVDAGREANLSPSEDDAVKSLLILVDTQIDFIHTDGALSVPGAIDDTRRTIEWLFEYTPRITTIAASLDSHTPNQIFFPSWWVDENGKHPAPYTVIHSADVDAGKWKPLYEPEWSMQYPHTLEKQAKKELMIWPYHTMIGTPGHGLTPALVEAVAYHCAARRTQPVYLYKGQIPQTEYYSMLEPEVKVPDHPLGNLNISFLNMINRYDKVYIAGQAKSHCVLETIASMTRYFSGQMNMLHKLRVLIDATSSVVHPTIDFDAIANRAFAEFEKQGVQLIKTTDPLR
jgi:nicotinamidase/pyrazinamidase